ncbi:MAG: MFS transporter [Candidatus Heimdallarchaeota archaeon]|nr:MAG: MFS transporter [Candidatus Heimdallarchaeota archaeon]
MKITRIFFIILPITVVWLLTPLFLLVYAFDLLSETFQMDITKDIFNLGVVILFVTTFLATVSLFLTGHVIDKNPQLLKPLITGSLLMTGVSLFLIVLGVDFVIFILFGLPMLGIFLGILATGAGALYAGHADLQHRGKIYASALFLSAILSLSIIPIAELLNWDFKPPLVIIGCFTILSALIFYYISQSVSPWVNDEFPTPIQQILNRRSVKIYLVSRFFIYLMLGIAFATISQIGQFRYSDLWINLPFFGMSQFDQRNLFWIIVFFGDLICVIPMGWFADRFGRKNLIVMGVYGIVISALIVGLSENPIMFYFSAYLLGVSFSMFHPSLDSAIWADISPLDSVGRYFALSFIFLLQGVGFGLVIGLFILPQSTSVISYVLIGVAVLGLFPLFFVADSFDPLEIYLLLVSTSGMCLFNYEFDRSDQSKITQKDLALVAGALSAISTFFEGLSDQSAVLDLVRHGKVFTVQAKAGTEKKELIATIFANKIDPELKISLDTFLARFCLAFQEQIDEWIGQANVFDPAVGIAEDIFGPLIPSKTALGSPKES